MSKLLVASRRKWPNKAFQTLERSPLLCFKLQVEMVQAATSMEHHTSPTISWVQERRTKKSNNSGSGQFGISSVPKGSLHLLLVSCFSEKTCCLHGMIQYWCWSRQNWLTLQFHLCTAMFFQSQCGSLGHILFCRLIKDWFRRACRSTCA